MIVARYPVEVLAGLAYCKKVCMTKIRQAVEAEFLGEPVEDANRAASKTFRLRGCLVFSFRRLLSLHCAAESLNRKEPKVAAPSCTQSSSISKLQRQAGGKRLYHFLLRHCPS